MLLAENLDSKIKDFWPKNGPPTHEINKYVRQVWEPIPNNYQAIQLKFQTIHDELMSQINKIVVSTNSSSSSNNNNKVKKK